MIQIPNQLKVKQKIDLLEVFTGFESRNRYEVKLPNDQKFLFAYETSGFLWRFFMSRNRPCEIHFIDDNKQEHLLLKRNFFWLFPSYELYANGSLIGKIKRQFAFMKTLYKIFNSSGEEVAELDGPFWKPWTFNIKSNGAQIGLMGKKFGGMKEFLTDSDNFSFQSDNFSFQIDDSIQEDSLKALVLACTFAVDYDNFEQAGN